MQFLCDFSFEELNSLCSELGEPSFRAKQLYSASHLYKSYDEMTNIPKTLRDKLKLKEIEDVPVKIIKTLESKDGTKKFLFSL
jgi:23S rRNA (adenine2503-C2)-methyltransferase